MTDTVDLQLLDRAFHSIMTTMIETTQAPHFTELAADLGIRPDEGREVVHQLVDRIPGWVHPGTDYLASFPPFNVQPTQYRITVDGQGGWFGQ
ncbi:MAG: hypothetical protein OEV40_21345 [Acidimicrobiia bacterium]|nr:hypothetical protein [Acidimicrobiia bacterium]